MKLFKNKIFRMLLWVITISSFGDSLYALAVTLSVYQMSGSIVGVAGMWMIRVLVRTPCQFVSGVIIDRFNRKKVSVYVYLLSAALMLIFALTDGKYMVLAYVLIFILQGTSDVDNMAQMALMPELVNKEELPALYWHLYLPNGSVWADQCFLQASWQVGFRLRWQWGTAVKQMV